MTVQHGETLRQGDINLSLPPMQEHLRLVESQMFFSPAAQHRMNSIKALYLRTR